VHILLINPPIREKDPPVVPPIGLANIAQAIIDVGHEVSILDIQAHRWKADQVLNKIRKIDFDLCGIGGIITTYEYIKFLTKEIKKTRPNIPIIVGGSVSSSIPTLLLERTQTDIAVIGEGEETIKELIEVNEDGRDIASVNGIYYKENGQINATKPRQRLSASQLISLPAWNLFDLDIYFDHDPSKFNIGSGRRCQAIITSRGCPNRCTFCHRNFGRRLVFRDLDDVIGEIKYFVQRWDILDFYFLDELFISTEKRTSAFCERLKSENLNIKFKCSARGNTVTENIIKQLVDVGLYGVNLGFESGSQRILDKMKKGTTVDQYRNVVNILRKYNLEENYTFIYGMPGENVESIKETINFIKDNNIDPTEGFCLFVATPYPGTELYNQALERGLIDDEEEFISRLEDATKYLVNFTEMDEKEFLRRKRKMLNEIQISYCIRNRYYKKLFIDSVKNKGFTRILKRFGVLPTT